METLDPIRLASQIEEAYRRYLRTTFHFKDPDFRASFAEELRSGRLSKGPYLEATPVFRHGLTLRELLPVLGIAADESLLGSLRTGRLYLHQEEAIRKLAQKRNIIVATGTGSGKTEAFIYPILLHLFEEHQKHCLGPGVRALVLYPMNALANDQRERLGEVSKKLAESRSPFRFTFGQYVGETPEDERDARRHAQEHIAARLPGELVLRAEMRRTPPHVLLTNYSMLEYLLLRPSDSPLFDNGNAKWWSFLILDEAHQYRGSRGIEMAMLLRRLKQRLRDGGRRGSFQCVATSATLVSGESAGPAAARFASDLFGEPFAPEDVILGEREAPPEIPRFSLSHHEYDRLATAVVTGDTVDLRQVARALGVIELPQSPAVAAATILLHDKRSVELLHLMTGSPKHVTEIAERVFPELAAEERVSALSRLVALLMSVSNEQSGAPLLSARYHLFLRSLEGAFVSYLPQKKVYLDRILGEHGACAFEVALCRECGQHYFVGSRNTEGGKLGQACRDPGDDSFGARFYRPLEDGESEQDDEADPALAPRRAKLCLECGSISDADPMCGHKHSIPVSVEPPSDDDERADETRRCSACGYSASGRDPIREVIYGSDGPHAVIATVLYQRLPQPRRKVLAFADGRQEAAFFAWYLEESYRDVLSRNLINKVVREWAPRTSSGLSLAELAPRLCEAMGAAGVFPEATGELERLQQAWRALYREFLTDEVRISLEGVGLVRWEVQWPSWVTLPSELKAPPWSLTAGEAWDVLGVLLDSMRAQKAIEVHSSGVAIGWRDLGLQKQNTVRMKGPVSQGRYLSWDGQRGRRASFLVKLLTSRNPGISAETAEHDAVELLRAVWEHLRRCDDNAPRAIDSILLRVGDGYRLNPDWWRVRAADVGCYYICDVCGRPHHASVGVCPRHGCPGRLREVAGSQQQRTPGATRSIMGVPPAPQLEEFEDNHYRQLYRQQLPGMLRVEEHTAQLEKELAREYQRDFRVGKIHLLSCSTTFELGVDLGDLDVIFLRNVPPEAFNYAQRVGRAGRRSGYPGFAVTYCRQNPHDLYHFAAPERMLAGNAQPPVLGLGNEKIISRHIAAVALSAFFQAYPARFESVAAFFRDLRDPSGVADLSRFLAEEHTRLEATLRAIVPADMARQVGLHDGTWVNRVVGQAGGATEDSVLAKAELELKSDYRAVIQLEERAREARDYEKARWAQRRAKTIAEEDTVSFLGRKAVIPKYGFPVDVVELDTQRVRQGKEEMDVSLERDLRTAISEYAPTSRVIANKREWQSYALKRIPEREWPVSYYARCTRHGRFERSQSQEDLRQCCDRMVRGKYIDPIFGFIVGQEGPREPKRRPSKVFSTRPCFAGFKEREGEEITLPGLTLSAASPGYLVVICEGRRGRGFYICKSCGAGFRTIVREHQNPYGERCRGTLVPTALGHEFLTDVLRVHFSQPSEQGVDPVWFGYSLAYALVEGAAAVLEVPSTDLSATVQGDEHSSMPAIILYDDVPGGAGLVARLEEKSTMLACLVSARDRVAGRCGCSPDTSCYGCLRSYRNQFAHEHLQRGPVVRYLDAVLSLWG